MSTRACWHPRWRLPWPVVSSDVVDTALALQLTRAADLLIDAAVALERPLEAVPFLREAATLFAQIEDRRDEALMWRRLAGAYEQLGLHALLDEAGEVVGIGLCHIGGRHIAAQHFA